MSKIEVVGQTLRCGEAEFTYEVREGGLKYRLKGTATAEEWTTLAHHVERVALQCCEKPPISVESRAEGYGACIGGVTFRRSFGKLGVCGESQYPFKVTEGTKPWPTDNLWLAAKALMSEHFRGLTEVNRLGIAKAMSAFTSDFKRGHNE